MLFDALKLDTPISGFSGLVKPDLSIIKAEDRASRRRRRRSIDPGQRTRRLGIAHDWLIAKADRRTPRKPGLSSSAEDREGCRSTTDQVSRLSASVTIWTQSSAAGPPGRLWAKAATANRSQPYYLDVTNKDANRARWWFPHAVSGSPSRIATIGDQPTDVPMFKRSGFSIAMGNASDEVKAQASVATDSYNDEGFAKAMERFILG